MATAVAAAGLAVLALTGGNVATAAPAEVAAHCQSYWPSPFQVCDQTKNLYNSLGGAASPLGFPSSAAQAYGTDGLRQTFTGGAIIWTPSTGAYIE
jgi:uncharacterized protein with LGFP repeats